MMDLMTLIAFSDVYYIGSVEMNFPCSIQDIEKTGKSIRP
jgi:hypothetical protein